MKYLIVGVIFVFVGCSGGDKAAGPIMNVSFEQPGIAGIRGVLGQQWRVESWVITTECDDNVVMTVTESPFCLIGQNLRNCKARPVSFVLNGATYTYSQGFSAYGVGEFGIYVNADDSTDRKRIQIISQIPSPITARFDVKFLLSHVASGGKLFGSLIGATGNPTIGTAPVMPLNMVDMNYVGVAGGILSFSLPVRCDQWAVANDRGHFCESVKLEGLYFKVADYVSGTVVDTAYLDSVLVGAPTLSDGAYSGKVVFVTADEKAGEHGGFNFLVEYPNCFEGPTDGCPTGTSHSHIIVAKYDHGNGGISYIYWTVEIKLLAPSECDSSHCGVCQNKETCVQTNCAWSDDSNTCSGDGKPCNSHNSRETCIAASCTWSGTSCGGSGGGVTNLCSGRTRATHGCGGLLTHYGYTGYNTASKMCCESQGCRYEHTGDYSKSDSYWCYDP